MSTPTTDGSVLTPDVDPTARATPTDPVAPAPDISKTTEALQGPGGRSLGVTVLTVLALLYTLFFARDFLLPVTVAVLLDFLLSPVVRALARLHVAPPLGAAVVVAVLLGTIGVAAYELTDPVQRWIERAPTTVSSAGSKVRQILRPVERVSKTAEQVASATGVGAAPTTEVVVKGPSVISRVFGTTQRFLAGLLEVIILLYFLLASGDLFLQKLIKVLPNLHDKRTAVQIARQVEASVSTYLLTQSFINLIEGAVVTGAMYLLGMPNAVLWGAAAALLEFIPYLGAAAMTAILTLAALTTFDNVGRALLVPASFLVINLIQANVVSPLLMSRRLTLNPVALFVGLTFWWWIWGIPGAFIAVPLLATFKIFCDHIESLAPVGEFLGKRDDGERRALVRPDDAMGSTPAR